MHYIALLMVILLLIFYNIFFLIILKIKALLINAKINVNYGYKQIFYKENYIINIMYEKAQCKCVIIIIYIIYIIYIGERGFIYSLCNFLHKS